MVSVVTAAAAEPPPGPKRPLVADASPAQVRAALIREDAVEFDRQWREGMTRTTEAVDPYRGAGDPGVVASDRVAVDGERP